jgi:hypothetical protein
MRALTVLDRSTASSAMLSDGSGGARMLDSGILPAADGPGADRRLVKSTAAGTGGGSQ